MKNYLLKSIILTLFVSVLSSCSNNDEQEPFDPVTIDLVGVDIEQNDTSFTQQGFNFTVFNAESSSSTTFEGILLAYPDNQGNPSALTLDLSSVSGITTITASIADQGGGVIDLMNNGTVIESINVDINPLQFRDFTFQIDGRSVDAFRFISSEGFIKSIRLE